MSASRDFDDTRLACHLTEPDVVLIAVRIWRTLDNLITPAQDLDTSTACRFNCARASCGLKREGFRSGSKLRKGCVSVGLGHKGSLLLLAGLAGLSVGAGNISCMNQPHRAKIRKAYSLMNSFEHPRAEDFSRFP